MKGIGVALREGSGLTLCHTCQERLASTGRGTSTPFPGGMRQSSAKGGNSNGMNVNTKTWERCEGACGEEKREISTEKQRVMIMLACSLMRHLFSPLFHASTPHSWWIYMGAQHFLLQYLWTLWNFFKFFHEMFHIKGSATAHMKQRMSTW